ncbi:MAG: GH25 family lysozyme [Sporolactobacillus sp.]
MNNKIKYLISLAIASAMAFSFAYPVAAVTPKVSFIDVSHHNGNNGLPLSFYQTIKRSGVNGVVVKVSEGITYLDPAASVNIANASQSGLVVNAYHFARFNNVLSAKAEADFFDKQLKYVGFSKLNDGIVVVDVETNTASRDILTAATNAFIDEMHQLGYPIVDVYSGSYFYNRNLDPNRLSVKDPWLAAYPYNPVHNQPTAHFVYQRGAWQWSSNYHFGGFLGNFDVSEDYAGKYSDTNIAPNSTPTKVVKKIGSVSLVNWLKQHKKAWSYSARATLAKSYGIANYSGTAAQNLALLSKLKTGVKPAPAKVVKQVTKAPVKKAVTSAYTVKPGDTLSSIGKAHGVNYRTIMSLNGLHSTVIYPGQRLRLTKTASKTAVKSSTHGYTVRSGDSLWAISRVHKTTVAHLKSLNKLKSDLIYPGQKIKY